MKNLLLSILCLALLALAGCAQKGQPLIPEGSASERWQAFAARSSGTGSYDVLSGSLRFGPSEATKRVTYTLWSELPEETPEKADAPAERTIRLEIGAGIGGSVGKMRFADGRMTLILPKEGRIYVGSSSDWNLQKLLGLSLPLGVQKLNDFLAGRLFSALDAPRPERYETQEGGGIVYRYKTKNGHAELTLDENALPVRWKEQNGWDMEIRFDNRGLPARLSGHIEGEAGEHRLVLLVKERRPAGSMQATGLHIPAGFTVYSLD